MHALLTDPRPPHRPAAHGPVHALLRAPALPPQRPLGQKSQRPALQRGAAPGEAREKTVPPTLNSPCGHTSHTAAPGCENRPRGQPPLQAGEVAPPSPKRPAAHGPSHTGADEPPRPYVPGLHTLQLVAPYAAHSPGRHMAQSSDTTRRALPPPPDAATAAAASAGRRSAGRRSAGRRTRPAGQGGSAQLLSDANQKRPLAHAQLPGPVSAAHPTRCCAAGQYVHTEHARPPPPLPPAAISGTREAVVATAGPTANLPSGHAAQSPTCAWPRGADRISGTT